MGISTLSWIERDGLVDHKSGDRYVKATPTIDPLLERRPTGSKAPAARPHSFRPLVIHGGARARSVPRESSWEAALDLINLGFLISQGNYLAFLQASIIVLEALKWTDPEKTS